MENNILKEKVRKNVKEKIAVANIREEFNMNNKKSIYWIISVCAVCVIVFGIIVGANDFNTKINNNLYATENEKSTDVLVDLKINKIENMAMKKLNAEMKDFKYEDLIEKFEFINNIEMLPEYNLKTTYTIFTKEDVSAEEYNLLHDYVLCYESDNKSTIKMAFSEIEKPLRDYFINSQNEISKIGDVEFIISQFEETYMITFNINGLYFDIEANGITETQLITLLNSISRK